MSFFDEQEIAKYIRESGAPVNLGHLVRQFRVKGAERREFRRLLKDLERQGQIARVRGKNYTAPSGRTGRIVGKLEVTTKGFGFVRPDWSSLTEEAPFEGDLFIPAKNMGDALDGDVVRAEVLRMEDEGPIGRIEEVLEHAHTHIVGRYQRSSRGGEVIPRNTRLERRINVPRPKKALGIQDFDWVEVEIQEFTKANQPLYGEIVERLGNDEDRGIDVLLLLRDKGILEEFPQSVEAEVKDMHFKWVEDLKGRKDYRKLPTITIDPKTAKDYDDGLSIERLDSGGWRLYVHIADVSHFVKPGTALEREAHDRATSVYPVDRVVPMLPHKLSNFLCSLVPNEDRLTMTAVIEISPKGQILKKQVHSSVIHSDYRLAYEEVQGVFDGTGEETHAFRHLIPEIKELRELAALLRKQRFKRGALDLDIPEVRIVFDEDGAASAIEYAPRFEAHQLVEECMLIANEAVALFLTEKQAPLLYRVHETADQDRLEKLEPALKVFNVRLKASGGEFSPHDLQKALDQAQAHPAGHIIRRLVLRALKRAEYDPDNAGHFGLATDCYCHFTSPIRRYPDLVVHRQVKSLERGGPLAYDPEENELDALGDHTSSRERRAQEAEWESTEIKSMEYMKQYEGEEFDGYICGVQNWGIFVELMPYPVQGFVKKTALFDKYDLDDTGVRLIGRNSGHRITLGDKVRVRIDRIDALARQLDLSLLDQPEPSRKRKSGPRGPKAFGEKKKKKK